VLVVAVNLNDWQTLAACNGHPRADDFYPPFHTERKQERLARERRAKAVCAACPVRNNCLEHALAVEERYGVWGGLSTDERRLVTLTA
jgi:WhiB family redox-sensing transcriptional regulator